MPALDAAVFLGVVSLLSFDIFTSDPPPGALVDIARVLSRRRLMAMGVGFSSPSSAAKVSSGLKASEYLR